MSALQEKREPIRAARHEAWYAPIVEFATHIVVGTIIFLLITVAAWVIHVAIGGIGKASLLLRYGLRTVEVVLFAADTLLFLVFILRTTWQTLRKLLTGWNG